MIKWIEATGKNEEAAIASALSQLGLERDDVSVEVLDRAKSGFLGIGASPARVKVSYEVPDQEETVVPKKKAVEAVAKPMQMQEPKKKEEPKEAPLAKHPSPPTVEEESSTLGEEIEDSEGEVETKVISFLTGLLTHMEVKAEPHISPRDEGGYQVTLEGEKLGALIGHRGETLDSIQQLTNYSINRGRARRVRIHIDVENYRSKREEALQHLAQKVAGKVVKYRRNITLEPMNAYERHVIHEALQEYPDVVTYSTGTEPNRRTVVAYTKGKHSY
jgi:spoIIIJ-associated protein